ncbi:putative G-protein coupled receptor B0563.6 [Oratosquilla oratoria]|uniref:putative G-protein coupled receptor B0563.6 n=1 Tax=Oratosquilla oratoria TaxID=337810 RepID=UPI003F76AC78
MQDLNTSAEVTNTRDDPLLVAEVPLETSKASLLTPELVVNASTLLPSDSKLRIQTLDTVTYSYVLPVLVALGTATNALNLWVLSRPSIQGATYRYLFWLALVDLFVCLATFISLFHMDRACLSYGWALYFSCFEIPVINGLIGANVYIVTGLSIDRYLAVCQPLQYTTTRSLRGAALRISTSLVVAFGLYVPHGILYQKPEQTDEGCWSIGAGDFTRETLWYMWEITVEICHRLAPSLLLAFLNLRVIIVFRREISHRRVLSRTSSTARQEAQQRRFIYLLLAMILCFFVTNLPAAVLALVDYAGTIESENCWPLEVLRATANCLEMLNFSLNFPLYFIFNTEIRRSLTSMGRSARRWSMRLSSSFGRSARKDNSSTEDQV